jgi:hypothetical protein
MRAINGRNGYFVNSSNIETADKQEIKIDLALNLAAARGDNTNKFSAPNGRLFRKWKK